MRHKPWPILVIAFFHCVLPFINVAIAARMSGVSYFAYLALFWKTASFLSIFTRFGLLPLAGLAVFSFRVWSYPVYLGVMAWASYNTLWSFHSLPHLSDLGSFALPVTINVVLMAYFLVPSVRQLYFNKSMRWWQSQERFPWKAPCRVETAEKTIPGEIRDISLGGVFVAMDRPVSPEDLCRICFQIGSDALEIPARGVYFRPPTLAPGGGFRFAHTKQSRKRVRRHLHEMKRGGVVPLNRVPLTGAGFLKWAKRLVTTGRGLFPEREP